jgi:hypothetical protein
MVEEQVRGRFGLRLLSTGELEPLYDPPRIHYATDHKCEHREWKRENRPHALQGQLISVNVVNDVYQIEKFNRGEGPDGTRKKNHASDKTIRPEPSAPLRGSRRRAVDSLSNKRTTLLNFFFEIPDSVGVALGINPIPRLK